MKYARVIAGNVTELIDLVDGTECRIVDGDPALRPVIYSDQPDHHAATQRLQERYIVTPTQVIVEYDVVPMYTNVADFKQALHMLIESWRDEAMHRDVEVHGRVWQGNNRSIALLTSAIALATAGAPLPPVWRDATNDDMSVTSISDLVDIATAIAINAQQAYARSWVLKEYVDSLSDTEDTLIKLSNLTWDSPLE